MARLSTDIPHFIINMLSVVDYDRITDAQYTEFMRLISEHLGKHLPYKERSMPLLEYYFPLRQDFCDLINRYDFKSLKPLQVAMFMPLAKHWANRKFVFLF